VADYSLVERALLPRVVVPGARPLGRDSRWRAKYLPAPVALFRESQAPGEGLLPVAILVDQPDAAGPNPVYLRGGPGWEVAKTYVRVADANVHENVTHNLRHHFVAEAFALATRRRLAWNHPVHVLLEPHLAHTLMVNSIIQFTLRTRGQSVENQFSGDLEESWRMIVEAHRLHRFRQLLLEGDVARRGVARRPADYPWRDDARRWIEPIAEFVSGYVRRYYRDDAAVAGDGELQAWAAELEAPSGGALRDVFCAPPGGPRPATRDELVEVLAGFLFLAGPSHAAIHFVLKDWLSWAPAFPRAAYAPPPADPAAPGFDARAHLQAMLPPATRAADQFQVGHLAALQYLTFGDYRRYRLGRIGDVQPLVHELRRRLGLVEAEIRRANATRPRPYERLLPSLVPNSVNI